ncbi:MAG: cytochrome-c peroxidase [Flavipsychrobacter sp.]|nr:cytochrome-c peroxidase [Flavipsychrobacter sp.]
MKKLLLLGSILLSLAIVPSCKKKAPEDKGKAITLDLPETPYAYYTGRKIVVPNQNEKATLGRVLFYDPQLSLNNAISCASCHKQEFAFSDNVAFSRGFENRLTGRNSMPLENLVFQTADFTLSSVGNGTGSGSSTGGSALFWDGREARLKDLIARPLTNHIEMGIEDVNALPQKLGRLGYYKELFEAAYPHKEVTFDQVSEAIAFFITSIKTTNTRFDQAMANKTNFTAMEQHGFNLVQSKYNCLECHRIDTTGYLQGSLFADIGLEMNADKGLGGFSGSSQDINVFKAPNLRNVALTAPYMHDGRFKTLGEVIDHYSTGIRETPNLAWALRGEDSTAIKMNISETEKEAIIAFLNTLTDHQMITDKRYSNPFVIK